MSDTAVRILHATVNVPLAVAYEYAHRPENFPEWAAGLSETLHRTDKGWVASTPMGDAMVTFSEPNTFGVLDHWVDVEGKPQVYIPLRMIANGSGTVVELVLLRQPGMTDADFDKDASAIEKDLASLKKLLEQRAVSCL
ncbi:MAG: SRPBCC family protein [Comamonadaceae bacterium]|nr:MAG: SRPBCC family protein [Comamonadaceae bacterium]